MKRWVNFGGHRQKVSELSPELRKRLGIEEIVEDEKLVKTKIKKENINKSKKNKEIKESNFLEILIENELRDLWKWLGKRNMR